ncbi:MULTISPECIES: DUF2975 domain-containing protein [Streptomyces]|uniref:DUF2975 domain-containing protein n=1 Tax=Streptomyces drozdowiczii TaxID=202862 RepID=A0ABY6PVE0_9ACTN|nr:MULTISPECIES: DUF2975 domain-containing protein [Streptomyces]MCX0244130.1 DUF2975 domain-containing protein [Streptomyces drozdowiczii]OKJ76037.1 hypothetical protein AMK30_07265 [Streptomyces sp. CB02460]UZK56052.1 DUF2975 domain-containing protein [Streptomyces drozdowiczii]
MDESGRRGKTLRRLGWVLAAVFVCYATTLVVAVLGGNSSAPVLPLTGQEQQVTDTTGNGSTAPDAGLPAAGSPAPAQEREGAN